MLTALLVVSLVTVTSVTQPTEALTVNSASRDCPPWVVPALFVQLPGGGGLGSPSLTGDRFLLVAPLWREGDHHRVILGAYGVDEVVLPRGATVHRVLIPSGVEWKWTELCRQAVPQGPWREVRYSLRKSDGLLQLKPSKAVDNTFVVEASLPARGEWVRIALAPGDWLVALGWSMDFNVLTLDGKVLFRGRHPYDEVVYDLPDGVHLAFWVHWYGLDLSGGERWTRVPRLVAKGEVPSEFNPKWQYEHGLFYGYCTVLEVRTSKPLILEFRAPRQGEKLESPNELVDRREFVTEEFVRSHQSHYVPPIPPSKLLYEILRALPVLPLLPLVAPTGRREGGRRRERTD